MIIRNIRNTNEEGVLVWYADVVFETEPVQTKTVYVRVPEAFHCDLLSAANGFLICCAPFALKKLERQIRVESEVDPRVLRGLEVALSYLALWNNFETPVLSAPFAENLGEERGGACASFLSGGCDSLATLMRNIEHYPESHPMRIRYGILVDGLDIGCRSEGDARQQELARDAKQALESTCETVGISPISIKTNVRSLDLDNGFYAKVAHGAILAGMAMFLSDRISNVLISSTNDLSCLDPWGSSPLLDAHYSSSGMSVHHDSEDLTRLQKLEIIKRHAVLLNQLRVCPKVYTIPDEFINCGQCEKCLRTQLECLALGIVEQAAFPPCHDFVGLIGKSSAIKSRYHAGQYREVVVPLREAGYEELAKLCEKKLKKWTRRRNKQQGEDVVGLCFRLALKLFNVNTTTHNPRELIKKF